MSVTAAALVQSFSANGADTVYTLTIERDSDTHIKAKIDEVAYTDFTISGADFTTGTVLASGVALVIYRETPEDQIQTFPSNTTPAAEDIEAGLDKTTYLVQELSESNTRSVKAPIGSVFTSSSTIGIDSSGDPIARTATQEVTHLGIGASVTAAALSETNAAASETAAALSETNAAASETAAEVSNVNASNAVLGLSSKSFAKALFYTTTGDSIITGDVVITLTGSPDITVKNSARPYTEDNAINGVGVKLSQLWPDIIEIIRGNYTDFDTSTDYGNGLGPTISNPNPIVAWDVESYKEASGDSTLYELVYYGSGTVDLSAILPSPYLAVPSTLSPPTNLPYLDKVSSTELSATHKGNLEAQWPDAIQAVQPTFTADPSVSGNATATTAAIQAAIDTRRSVFIPDGKYVLNATLTIETQGQTLRGGNGTRTILTWTADVHGIQVLESTESTVTNLPGSAAAANSWGTISNMVLIGPAGSTKRGITNFESATPSLWIGEAWHYDNLFVQDWLVGIYSSKAARLNSRSISLKGCGTGLYLTTGGSGSNNCHNFYGITFNDCTRGIYLNGITGGEFHIQDAVGGAIQVEIISGSCRIIGGRMETYTTTSIHATDSTVFLSGQSFADGTGSALPAVQLDGRSTLNVQGVNQVHAAGGYLVEILDVNSTVYGSPGGEFAYSNRGTFSSSLVKLLDATIRTITPFPWRVSVDLSGQADEALGMLSWDYPAAGQQSGDLSATIRSPLGTKYRGTVFRPNNPCQTSSSANPTMAGWEAAFFCTGTAAKAFLLPLAADSVIGANGVNARHCDVFNAGATGDVTVTPRAGNTLNGGTAGIVISPLTKKTIYTTGGTEWFIS